MKQLICLECPNGCNLTVGIQSDGEVDVTGNKCEKGAYFAVKVLQDETPQGGDVATETKTDLISSSFVAKAAVQPYTQTTLSSIMDLWGIDLKAIHPHVFIDGSPERAVFRVVVEDNNGRRYILEKIPHQVLEKKIKIAQVLEYLDRKQLQCVQPYIANSEGKHILEHEEGHWQVMPFVEGSPLDRMKYIYEEWRGAALAAFQIDFKQKSTSVPCFDIKDNFSLKKYIYTLLHQIGKYQTDVKAETDIIIKFLEKEFMSIHDELPLAFCHGDYHPLNIIWSSNEIKAVIDWEFCGYKPEIYDVSNLIGCVGMEHPSSLNGDLVNKFLSNMRDSGLICDFSWQFLVEFMVAMRFAWLSEWLRKADTEMIELEMTYMRLLIDNKEDLKDIWNL